MTLKQVKSNEISAYHIAFSYFRTGRNYYFKDKNQQKNFQDIQNSSQSVSSKYYKDDILSKSTNYRRILKHLHSSKFKQVIQIEIN